MTCIISCVLNLFVTDLYSYLVLCGQWDPKELSWASFRGELLGPTDPAQAPAGSIRKEILDK